MVKLQCSSYASMFQRHAPLPFREGAGGEGIYGVSAAFNAC